MGESGLSLVAAHLGVAAGALRAATAGADEGDGDPLPHPEVGHLLAHRVDPTHQLVTRDLRQGDVGVLDEPAADVAATQPGRLDPDDDAGRTRSWRLQLADGRPLAVGVVLHGSHERDRT